MRIKAAIIDPLGAHGSSHHFYLFGQLDGLRNNEVNISLYTNNKTENPNIKDVKFHSFYNNLFSSKFRFVSGFRWVSGSLKSIIHARFSGVSFFHFHIFYTNILVLFNLLLVKLVMGKVVLTIHDVTSFADRNRSSFIANLIYKLTDAVLTHNEFSKEEFIKFTSISKNDIHIVPHGNYTQFINIRKDKTQSRSKLDLPQDKTILLFFGMIKKVKGLEV
ncbi:MAG: glycosyltransferase, partial [Flavobacteriales bacterium]|nr:glycosyltransferase [Flavobacteriales bacterium]